MDNPIKLIRLPLPSEVKENLLLSRLGIKTFIFVEGDENILSDEMKKIGNATLAKPKYGRIDPYMPLVFQVNKKHKDLWKYDTILIIKKKLNKKVSKIRENKTNISYINELIKKAKKIRPIFPDPIKKKFAKFYVKVRKIGRGYDIKPILINPNDLNSLRKICIAYAKLRLSKKVEIYDYDKTILLYKYLMNQGYIFKDLKRIS
jgi:DNA replicative helicase MCM subunit Mcm2 (Cdc46/Mcm family)|tara:strand:+ start:521 stop:1132 length:612 start_codon:yes stop_codon:yes gene_type:complete